MKVVFFIMLFFFCLSCFFAFQVKTEIPLKELLYIMLSIVFMTPVMQFLIEVITSIFKN